MAISKRLRFEVMRRDNHSCRYCGRTAPEWPMTIDHVVPVSLGGGDEPSNLVTACKDCNAGKSSVPASADLITDVSADAMRWAEAMETVARTRALMRQEAEERYSIFLDAWQRWGYTYMGQRRTVDLPGDWKSSITQFLEAGLEMDDLTELVDVAMGARTKETWRYFCGCCWQRIKHSHEAARALIDVWDQEDD